MKKLLLIALALMLSCGPAQASAINKILVDKNTGSFALGIPIFTNARSLAASVAESITVPTGPNALPANYVSFSSTCDFYVNYTTTATVPGDVTDGTASELNPLLRQIGGVTTISIITAASACVVTASFFM